MIIGDMILANEVLSSSNNQTILNVPNNIFPVLSLPAYISFGAVLVVSGIDFNQSHDLTIELFEKENEQEKSTIFKQRIETNPQEKDPHPTLSANISLRNVIVNNIGHHKVVLKVDDQSIEETIINIVKATPNR